MDFICPPGMGKGRMAEITRKPNYFLCTSSRQERKSKKFSFATKITLSCFRWTGVRGVVLSISYIVRWPHNVQEYPFKMYPTSKCNYHVLGGGRGLVVIFSLVRVPVCWNLHPFMANESVLFLWSSIFCVYAFCFRVMWRTVWVRRTHLCNAFRKIKKWIRITCFLVNSILGTRGLKTRGSCDKSTRGSDCKRVGEGCCN